jgi:hypothetical protein
MVANRSARPARTRMERPFDDLDGHGATVANASGVGAA